MKAPNERQFIPSQALLPKKIKFQRRKQKPTQSIEYSKDRESSTREEFFLQKSIQVQQSGKIQTLQEEQ